MNKWTKGITIIVIGVGGYLFLDPRNRSVHESPVNIGVVKRQDLFQRVNISGVIVPHRMMLFVPPYEGIVQKIYPKIGDKVKAGDPIVKVTPGADEEVFPLRSPFNGTVVQILKSPGEFVEKSKADALVRIDDTSRLYVQSDVPEPDYSKLTTSQEVIVKANAILDKTYRGRLIEVSQAARSQDRWERSKVEFSIRAEIQDADGRLKPGMSVVLDVITDKASNALTVLHEFVQKDGDRFFVTMENGQKRPIEIGLRNDEAFEVRHGLAEGDRLLPTKNILR